MQAREKMWDLQVCVPACMHAPAQFDHVMQAREPEMFKIDRSCFFKVTKYYRNSSSVFFAGKALISDKKGG